MRERPSSAWAGFILALLSVGCICALVCCLGNRNRSEKVGDMGDLWRSSLWSNVRSRSLDGAYIPSAVTGLMLIHIVALPAMSQLFCFGVTQNDAKVGGVWPIPYVDIGGLPVETEKLGTVSNGVEILPKQVAEDGSLRRIAEVSRDVFPNRVRSRNISFGRLIEVSNKRFQFGITRSLASRFVNGKQTEYVNLPGRSFPTVLEGYLHAEGRGRNIPVILQHFKIRNSEPGALVLLNSVLGISCGPLQLINGVFGVLADITSALRETGRSSSVRIRRIGDLLRSTRLSLGSLDKLVGLTALRVHNPLDLDVDQNHSNGSYGGYGSSCGGYESSERCPELPRAQEGKSVSNPFKGVFYIVMGGMIFDVGLLVFVGGIRGMVRHEWNFGIGAVIIGFTTGIGSFVIISHGIGSIMKQPEYTEGPEAQKNFEEGMRALFNVPKDEVVKAEKRRKKKRDASRDQSIRKPRPSDKD